MLDRTVRSVSGITAPSWADAFPPLCLFEWPLQMETVHWAQHCFTDIFAYNTTLEHLANNTQNPCYFWAPPLPRAVPHNDDADLQIHKQQSVQHIPVSQAGSSQHPRGISAIRNPEHMLSQQAQQHSLGSEPRIGRRAARHYRVGVSEWNLGMQRRWDVS